jgi:hypothetical protein
MTNVYENIVKEFEKRDCKLLTSKEEHAEILNQSKKQNYKLKYIASCGHEHIVFYNVFKSRGTGLVCPSCKNKQIGNNKKEKINNNEMSKISFVEQEFNYIMKLKEFLKNDFEIIKAFDGCQVDIIYRPKNFAENKWVGIQVKTTGRRYLTYSFHIQKEYVDCLLLLNCVEDDSTWLIPENIIRNQKKISIGFSKSKYNIYKVSNETIGDKMLEFYNKTTKFSFDELNLPINFYQQREQEFRKYREEKISFIKFEYDEMEATVYDFKIGNFKIQEKVSTFEDNYSNFCLYKHDDLRSVLKVKRKFKQYDIGDNDFYWLNFNNKKTFFVIPEKILIDKDLVGNKLDKNKLHFRINMKNLLCKNKEWLNDYIFDYDTIHHEIEKTRLCKLFQYF